MTIQELARLAAEEPRGGLIEISEDDALGIVAYVKQLERELGKYREELAGRDREIASIRDRLHAALYPNGASDG